MRRLWWVGVVLLPLGVAVGMFAAGSGARLMGIIESTPSGCGATTEPATSVTTTSATLNGLLGDSGGDAGNCGHWFFDYGTTIAYGSTTPAGVPQEGSEVPVSMTVTGLTPDTTYHFRLRAESGLVNVGDDVTFHTPAPPPPPPKQPTPSPTLGLTDAVSPSTTTTGSSVTFTIVVSNGGAGDAGQTIVRDTLPGGLTAASASASVGSCTGTATVTCTVGILGAGKSATITIVATAASAGAYADAASVESPDAVRPAPTASAALTVTNPPPPATTGTTTMTPTTTTPSETTIDLDQSLDGIALGETEQEVEKALGPPVSSLTIQTEGGGTGKLGRYRFHGALFLVTFDGGGHVVQLETYSPFFRAANGAGPGAPITLAGELPGFHTDPCELGYWNGSASTKPSEVVTAFTPNGGLTAAVLITVFAYYTVCQGGGQEQTPPVTLTLDRSVGGVSLGESEADVVKQYGKPQASLDITLGGGLTGKTVRYRIHGAPFLITYDQHGRVVSLQTYSPFFRTAGNLGPGAALGSVQQLKGFHPETCEFGYWNWRPGFSPSHVITVFTPNGGLVASVLITQLRLYTACAAGSTELPPQ